MAIAYETVYADLYSLVAIDTAGADVRALVNSIFPAEQLNNLNGKTLPYLVWRAGAVAGASHEMRDVAGAWWVYVGPTDSTRKLHQVATALEALYRSPFTLDWGRLGVTFIGQPFIDKALALQGLEVRVGYRRLG